MAYVSSLGHGLRFGLCLAYPEGACVGLSNWGGVKPFKFFSVLQVGRVETNGIIATMTRTRVFWSNGVNLSRFPPERGGCGDRERLMPPRLAPVG